MPAVKRPADRAPRRTSSARPRQIVVLIVGPLLCVIALTALAFAGLSLQAQSNAQSRLNLAALAARSSLLANMGDLVISNGQLGSSLPANVMTLNDNEDEALRLRGFVGVDTLIAQREGRSLVVTASTLMGGHGAAPAGLGENLTGSVGASACSANGGSGLLSVDGVSYLARSAPLISGSGTCVGALVTVLPISSLLATPLQYTFILAMAGALLALTTVAIGLSMGARTGLAADAQQTEQVGASMALFATAEGEWAAQMARRGDISARLTMGSRRLQRLMATLANDRLALQDNANDIWAGVSHPGAPIDPGTALHLAREGAVAAARVGSRLNDLDDLTDTLLDDLDASHEVDEMLADALNRAEEALAALRTATGSTSATAEFAAPQQAALPVMATMQVEDTFDTNKVETQRRYTSEPPAYAPEPPLRSSGAYRAVRQDSTQQRAIRPDTSQHRAMREYGASGQMPSIGQSQHGQRPINPGASGIQRHQGLAGSSGRNRPSYGQAGPRPSNGPRPHRPPQLRPDYPSDGRDRDSSGSRWLND